MKKEPTHPSSVILIVVSVSVNQVLLSLDVIAAWHTSITRLLSAAKVLLQRGCKPSCDWLAINFIVMGVLC